MVAGAAGIDLVMLVIAADEGIMPQTREHLDICRLLSVPAGIVVLNKCDKVSPDWLALQEEEARAFVRGTFLADAPILPVSAVTGEGLPRLVAELDRLASRIPGKDPSLFFRLPVDRSFTIKGFGTVVTGTIVGGTVAAGDDVQALPGGPVARVRGLQIHGGATDSASAGTRTAVNLQGVEKESVPRGSVLCHPGTFVPTGLADVFLEYLALAPRPLRNRSQVSFHAGTHSCRAKVVLYGADEIPSGGSGYARIVLDEATVLAGGDRFILRGFSPLENFGYTIGGGRVLNPYPSPRRGRGQPAPEPLIRLQAPEPGTRVLAAVDDAGTRGLGEKEAAIVAGVGLSAVRGEIDRLVGSKTLRREPGGSRMWHAAAVGEAGRLGVEALSALHDRFRDREGFPAEEIAALLPGDPAPALVSLALAEAPAAGRTADLFFLTAKRPRSVELSSPLARAIAEKVRGAGLSALTRTEIADALWSAGNREFDKTLEGLVKSGAVLRVKELHFDPAAVAALREKLVAYLEKRGEIAVPEFKELTGLSRKYIIPLLEHFDLAKVTLRVGDKRVLRKGR